jgi:hypothetical protein
MALFGRVPLHATNRTGTTEWRKESTTQPVPEVMDEAEQEAQTAHQQGDRNGMTEWLGVLADRALWCKPWCHR